MSEAPFDTLLAEARRSGWNLFSLGEVTAGWTSPQARGYIIYLRKGKAWKSATCPTPLDALKAAIEAPARVPGGDYAFVPSPGAKPTPSGKPVMTLDDFDLNLGDFKL